MIFPGILASAVCIAKILLCYAYLRLFQTGSKGGKYSGLNNAEICKVYRQSMSDAKKEKERLRKQQWRAALKKQPEIYKKHLESDRLRKQHSKIIKSFEIASSSSSNSQSPTSSQPSPSLLPVPTTSSLTPVIASHHQQSAFSTKQSRSRSLKKAEVNLPQSPRKKAEVIKNLASKYQIRIQLKETRGRPRKNLSDDKKAWLIEVLGRSDLTYTNPGRADNVYIGKIDGERQYLPRQYLLWSLKDLHDILNGTSASIG